MRSSVIFALETGTYWFFPFPCGIEQVELESSFGALDGDLSSLSGKFLNNHRSPLAPGVTNVVSYILLFWACFPVNN